MPVYDIAGNEQSTAYGVSGTSLSSVFSVGGTEIVLHPDSPVTPMEWNMSSAYKAQVLNALDYIQTYETQHPGAYAICQFNDVHDTNSGNEPNFIDYNGGYELLSRMIHVGDMVHTPSSSAVQAAIDFIEGAQASSRLVTIGNHEYAWDADQVNPEVPFATPINVPIVYMLQDHSALIYYNDDTDNNVRYIVLNPFYITKQVNSHRLGEAQLNWCASVLEASGDKDIIICCHSDMRPFVYINNGVENTAETELKDQDSLISLILAFKNRSTYSITVNSVEYTHDFSQCTGDFIMYTSGHWHALGYSNKGFNMFTGPSLKYTSSSGQTVGFLFYIIDPRQKAVKVIMCSKNFTDFTAYDYTF